MKNPLRKRLLRELRGEIGKYAAILILLVAAIGFVSGFLVASGSMITAYGEGFEKYNIEDGHFEAASQADLAQKARLESYGVSLYDQFYVETELDNQSTLRIYGERDEVNKVCLMEGEFPARDSEIVLDRMYAANNKLSVGDTVTDGENSWTITGLAAFPDYSCLFADNGDSMFDAIKFGVGMVTREAFAKFDEESLSYVYAWKYDVPPQDDIQEKEQADAFLAKLNEEVALEEFVPCYLNQAIQFTGDDMGSDKAMMTVLLYMVIVIMAFVFGLTTGDTIMKEANVIGTLRASGYTKGELVRHYMAMPVLITAIGAVIGNVLGYTFLKDVCAWMYYNSYSLPTYVTIWNAEAFVLTTVIPVTLMLIINYIVLKGKLTLPILRFLRRDLGSKRKRGTLRLSKRLPFFSRFRLRVIFQNVGNYVILFCGILFANLLLLFGLIMPSILDHFQETIADNMLCNYQYILTLPVENMNDEYNPESLSAMLQLQSEVSTDNEDAEKFSAYTLDALGGPFENEEVLFYGIEENSRYIDLGLADGDVYVSGAYAGKFHLSSGDTIRLKERYEDTEYTFTVSGIYDYDAALAVFMTRDYLNEVFDLGDNMFSGYLSDTEITDIDSKYIGNVIDLESLTKVSRQLDHSLGNMMFLVEGFAVLIFVVIIYLLSKMIIEKNAGSISMTKILGYTNREISRLYMLSTTIVVIFCILVSLPIEAKLMQAVWDMMMTTMMSGWLPYYLDPVILVQMAAIGIVSYAFVAVYELRKIKRVPMDMALKNAE